MDVVTINGVDYQRISTLTRRFKYTADYIGQLCRSHKVDAQLVGRSWYVNPDSLENHKKARFQKSPSNEKTIKYNVSINKTPVKVESVVTKNTARMSRLTNNNFSKHINWKPVKYSTDEKELYPSVKPKMKPVDIKIDLAEASEIPIKKGVELTTLSPESLPAIPMAGRVKVKSLDEVYLSEEVESGSKEAVSVSRPKISPKVVEKPRIKPRSIEDVKKISNSQSDEVIPLTPLNVQQSRVSSKKFIFIKFFRNVLFGLIFLFTFILVALFMFEFDLTVTESGLSTGFKFSTDLFSK